MAVRRGAIGGLAALLLLLGGCVTGETASDPRAEAIRTIVRDAGVTEDVATCYVDAVQERWGLEVLDDEDTSDAVSAAMLGVMTECVLAVPGEPSGP